MLCMELSPHHSHTSYENQDGQYEVFGAHSNTKVSIGAPCSENMDAVLLATSSCGSPRSRDRSREARSSEVEAGGVVYPDDIAG